MRAKRGDVGGWSNASTRSNTRFLYSVDSDSLSGSGYALSLTIRDCPPTSDDWHRIRVAYFKRLRRLGLIRMHWLTEWQRRGVPHLHGAVWFGPEFHGNHLPSVLVEHWMFVARAYGAGRRGQHMARIDNAIGWFQYLSKHAVRGLFHYQRSPENVPESWRGKTGRMWGYLGDWQRKEAIEIRIDRAGFFAFRRIVQRWRVASARASGDARRVRAARRMLQASKREIAEVRGVSEWIGTDEQNHILAWLAGQGYRVES